MQEERKYQIQSRKIPCTKGNPSVTTCKLFPLLPCAFRLTIRLPLTTFLALFFAIHPQHGASPWHENHGSSGRQPGSPLATSPATPKSKGSAHTIAGVCIQYRLFPVQEHRCGRSIVSHVAAQGGRTNISEQAFLRGRGFLQKLVQRLKLPSS